VEEEGDGVEGEDAYEDDADGFAEFFVFVEGVVDCLGGVLDGVFDIFFGGFACECCGEEGEGA